MNMTFSRAAKRREGPHVWYVIVIALIAVITAGYESRAFADSNASSPTAAYDAWKAHLAEQGFSFTVAYRSEDLAAVSGGSNKDLVHAGQIALITKFNLQSLVGWQGASVTASLTYRDGNNVNDESQVNALLGPQEIFGRGHFLRLTQFWFDQALFGDHLQLRAGRLNPGNEFQATECSFVNLSFCANQAGNFVSDYWYNWPISQWGAVAQIQTDPTRYLKVGIYQVNPYNLDSDFLRVLDPKGGTGSLVPVEIGWTPSWAGLTSEYKLGGWYSSALRADVYSDINGQSAAESDLPFFQRRGAWGAFFSIVQQLTRGNGSSDKSGLRAVLKASLADQRTSTVDRTMAATLVYTGTFLGRSDDLGIALAFNHLNDRVADYRAERTALGKSGLAPGDYERTFEAYYSLRIGSVLMFRPDFQWIHNPGGISFRKDVLIVGMRTEVTL